MQRRLAFLAVFFFITGTNGPLSLYGMPMMPTNPVSMWLFDEGSGTTAFDLGLNSNTGTLINMEDPGDWSTDTITNSGFLYSGNRALRFNDGDTNELVSVPAHSSLEELAGLTLSAWINPKGDPGSGSGRIVTKSDGGFEDDYSLSFDLSGVIKFRMESATTGFSSNLFGSVTITPNTGWRHVLGTWDGMTMSLFIDSIADGTLGQSDPMANDSNVLAIGRHGTNNDERYFDGLLDEIAIFNYALGQDEIDWLFLNSLIAFTFVPEPSDYLLLAIGFFSSLYCYRKIRRSKK